MASFLPGYKPQADDYSPIGSPDLNGSFRWRISSGSLYLQQRVADEWVDVHEISGNMSIDVPISLSSYIEDPSRFAEHSIHGGLETLDTGESLADGSPINVTKGTGKVLIVLNAGGTFNGTMTVTGTTVNRNTQAETPADTEEIEVDMLSTDNSSTDAGGNVTHGFENAYITSKWFTGAVEISTVDLDLSDVDVYHVSFEQLDDQPNITLESIDLKCYVTDANPGMYLHYYVLEVTGSKCEITKLVDLTVEGVTANKYERRREGNLDREIDGTTDGIWVDIFYDGPTIQVEDISVTIWASITKAGTFE